LGTPAVSPKMVEEARSFVCGWFGKGSRGSVQPFIILQNKYVDFAKPKNERVRKDVAEEKDVYWLNHFTRPGSANENASCMLTSDILTHSFILGLIVNTFKYYKLSNIGTVIKGPTRRIHIIV